MKKKFSYTSIIIGVIVIALMSGMVYKSIAETNSMATYKIKEFHAGVLAESEIEKALSLHVLETGVIEETVNVGGYDFVVLKDVSQVKPNLKYVSINVFYEHLGKSYSTQLYTNVKGW